MGEQVNKYFQEQPKKDEKVEEQKPGEKTDSPAPPPPSFVLYTDLHCVGCAKKIEKVLIKMKGIEGVVIDMANNQVTLKGLVEPQAICNRIMKKTKRMAKVLSSPLFPDAAAGEPSPQVVASQATEPTTVELDVNMHCQACADQLKKKLLKMKGVQKVEIELKSCKVAVTGTMDPKNLVDYVYQRTKKQAKIVPQPEPAPAVEEKKESEDQPKPKEEKSDDQKIDEPPAKEEEKKVEDDKQDEMTKEGEEHYQIMSLEEEQMKKMYYFYPPQALYVVERQPPAPQIFSEENPNACTIC